MFCACCKSEGADPPEFTETYVKPSVDPDKDLEQPGPSLFHPDNLDSTLAESNTTPPEKPTLAEEATATTQPAVAEENTLESKEASPSAEAGKDAEATPAFARFAEAVGAYRHAEAFRYLEEASTSGSVPEDLKSQSENTRLINSMYTELTARLNSISDPKTVSSWVRVEDKSINANVYYYLEPKKLVVHAVAYFDLPNVDPLKVFAALREFDLATEWVPYVSHCQVIDNPCDEIGYYQCTQSFNVGVKSLKMDSCQRRVYSDALDEPMQALWFMAASEAADAKELDGRPLPPPAKGVVRSPASLAATVAPIPQKGGTRFVFASQGDVPFRIPDWILGVVCKFLVRGFVKGVKHICDHEEVNKRMKSGPRAAFYAKLGERLEAKRQAMQTA
mmetsp:Transcript_58339/g.139071  ORF Transcript_58339/g.139071 Transcript_58339/m.139071 type:complete len:391 (+) Transcript_58339:100-1272(+)